MYIYIQIDEIKRGQGQIRYVFLKAYIKIVWVSLYRWLLNINILERVLDILLKIHQFDL